MRKSIWRNNKKLYSGKLYQASYKHLADGSRVFVLKRIANADKRHTISFESWQAAKYQGWYKVAKSKPGYVLGEL